MMDLWNLKLSGPGWRRDWTMWCNFCGVNEQTMYFDVKRKCGDSETSEVQAGFNFSKDKNGTNVFKRGTC